MKCENCGKEIPNESKFCIYCGTPCKRQIQCPTCEAMVDANLKYCPQCGSPLPQNVDNHENQPSQDKTAADAFDEKNIMDHSAVLEDTIRDKDEIRDSGSHNISDRQERETSAQQTVENTQQPVENEKTTAFARLLQNRAVVFGGIILLFIILGMGVFFHNENKQPVKKDIPVTETKKEVPKKKAPASDLALGPVYVGESWTEAHQELGKELRSATEPHNYIRYKFKDMEVVVSDGTVVALVSRDSSVSTRKGIHQGSSLSDVLNAYGSNYQESDYDSQTYYEYTYKTKDGVPALLRFAVNNDSHNVDYISIRDLSDDINNAKKAFLAYHNALSRGQIKDAFQYFTPGMQDSVGGYDGYAVGYGNTVESKVTNIGIQSAGPSKVVFSYKLQSKDRIPGNSRLKVQHFTGSVTMVNDNGQWKIQEISGQKNGERLE